MLAPSMVEGKLLVGFTIPCSFFEFTLLNHRACQSANSHIERTHFGKCFFLETITFLSYVGKNMKAKFLIPEIDKKHTKKIEVIGGKENFVKPKMPSVSPVIVKKGKEEKDNELFAIGTQFKDYRIPYNEHLDTLIMWSQKAMRDDRGLSDGIARVYDEQADKIFADAESVYITVSE